ncbi:Phosphatidylinositol-specific phospholipase C, Y domain protein, partial [Teladorsagia circumcincta]
MPIPYSDPPSQKSVTQSSLYRKQSKNSYESSMVDEVEDDDLDEFLDDEENDDDDTEAYDLPAIGVRTESHPEVSPQSSRSLPKAVDAVKQDFTNSEHSDTPSKQSLSYKGVFDSKTTDDDILYSPMSVSSGSRTLARKINAGLQIAPELSDIVVYLQATKFKQDSVSSESLMGAGCRPNASASCYQVTSLNENAAKKLIKRHPFKCISYTRDHMVALNFQTPDVIMAVNQAMFEQSGCCGFQQKPRVLWDATHPLHGKFNPLSKDAVNSSAIILSLTVISGQHVYPGFHYASLYVEIEVIGIPCDCVKERTKVVQRNSVNPLWAHTTELRITFVDLAFLRLAVCD